MKTAEEKIKAWVDMNTLSENPLLVRQLRKKISDPELLLEVLEIFSEICLHCFDAKRGCQCSNDE